MSYITSFDYTQVHTKLLQNNYCYDDVENSFQ